MASPASSNDGDSPSSASGHGALTSLKGRAAAATQTALHAGARKLLAKSAPAHDGALEPLHDDAAFAPTATHRQQKLQTSRSRGPVERGKAAALVAASALAHPKRTAKARAKRAAAGKVASVQKPGGLPVTAMGLRADDGEASGSGRDEERVRQFHRQREGMKVAWTTRHVRLARVVPTPRVEFPRAERYYEKNGDGAEGRFAWERWIGHLLLYYTQNVSVPYIEDFDDLPFDLDVLRSHAERLIMSSAPWQVWLMRVRAVYRWENPASTMKWLALYIFLWQTDLMMCFIWSFILYFVIRNHYYPSSFRHLQASIDRTISSEGSALALDELMDRHGSDNWLDPFIDQLGPYVQLQLGDLADLLEILANFYTWKSPLKTVSSLIFFAACLAVSFFGDTRFNLRIVYFIAGGAFFFCWPIASRYPQYRFLVSPFRWVLWDLPTHADLAFLHLRKKGDSSRETLIQQKVERQRQRAANGEDPRLERYEGHLETPQSLGGFDGANGTPRSPHGEANDASTSLNSGHVCAQDSDAEDDDDDDDGDDDDWHSVESFDDYLQGTELAVFPASCSGMVGRLVVQASGVCFRRLFRAADVWDVAYRDICELRKFRSGPKQNPPASADPAAGGAEGEGEKEAASPGKKRKRSGSLVSKHALEIQCVSGKVYRIEALQERDEVFNWIVGFSGARWQNLQPRLRR